ncbi:uncharacterized protein LOC125036185 [Penaeus chinensis]|uniref:uncharacterized protein LOC125036185 n=1 Tax=Penaeus chinensis TaxID=139456 RepID=UPI001FB6854D|nr:uncharacterized protein LOC125036185 [Penaeus chinensis]
MEYGNMEINETTESGGQDGGRIPVAPESSAFMSGASSAPVTARAPRRRARSRGPTAAPGHFVTGAVPMQMQTPSTNSPSFGFTEGASNVGGDPAGSRVPVPRSRDPKPARRERLPATET